MKRDKAGQGSDYELTKPINSLERILDGIDTHIYVTVPKTGELLFVNKQLRAATGRENDDFVGEFCYKVFRGLDQMCDFCPCRRLDENPEQTIVWEEYVEIYDRHVIHSDSYIDWPNGEKVHLQHVVDITDLRTMTNALNEAKETAERGNRHKTEFLARMSHEMRTSLNAIIGMTELALRENRHDARTEHILTIKQAGANLLAIINDILDFSKIEAGKAEIVPNDYSVASLLNDVITIIRMRAADSRLHFAVKADSHIPHMLYGDETRIRQALLNILSNAAKYTEKGFVSLGVYGEKSGNGWMNLIFEVTDSGIGIKPEDIEKLFSDFTQLDLVRNRGIEGIGLGLAITRGLVRMMGGDITVRSEYGKGSTFTITLPQKVRSREPLAKIERPRAISALIYERRRIYAESLAYAGGSLGVDFTLAASGTELYEKMESRVYDFLFIPSVLYKKNEDTILKFGHDTKTVILAEFGEAVFDKNLGALSMPVYCVCLADMLNGVQAGPLYAADTPAIEFSAPDARVLIVDDINTNLKVAQGLLAPYNMRVDLATGGAAAIEAIQSERYDIVFMDHKMPQMDGVEATRLIREMGEGDPYYREIPVIALTANAVSGIADMFIENGFNDFLSKPIDTAELNTILEKWLPKEKQESKDGKKAGV